MIIRTVKLPSSSEIKERLKKKMEGGVENNEAEQLYSMIAQDGGCEFSVEGLVLALTSKIFNFVIQRYPSSMEHYLYEQVPSFIDALIDDKKFASDVKKYFNIVERSLVYRTPQIYILYLKKTCERR